jgi:CDP-glucose 4,6-dehydratase
MLTELRSAFAGRTVLVTGHTGFKGSWLSLWLHRLGARVAGYALDPKEQKGIFLRARVGGLVDDRRGDIRDYKGLQEVFTRHVPEFVFHLAAQPLVREGYQEPKETLDVNIGGTVNVLEACRQAPSVKAVVVVTSDKCYLNNGKASPYREGDRLGGHDPYGASKACAEIVAHAYEQSFFRGNAAAGRRLGFATARAGNVIGGGDWALDRIVPDCIRSLSSGRIIRIRNPRHTRPWQFVLEPLAGYLLLAANLHEQPEKFSGAWNFGPDPEANVPVTDLVEKIITVYGRGSWQSETDPGQPLESHSLALDAAKAAMKLKWCPLLSLKQAVEMTVDWYKYAEANHDLRDFSLNQIEAYAAELNK